MNDRNINLIAAHNPRHLYPLVDNKLKTKLLAHDKGVETPRLIAAMKTQHDVRDLDRFLAGHDGFAIKPAKGSGGKGIMVIVDHQDDSYVKPSGAAVSFAGLARHIRNTLSGLFSLGGKNDVAMIETMVDFDDCFEGFTFEGVPDIRVISYKGFPAMAMTRLSTKASDGKANLHQGAVGVGLDIGTGRALRAVQYNRPVEVHPDTNARLGDIVVPRWDELVHLTARCFEVTDLGYLGVDIVLDRNLGPLVLEMNARPGLAIQVANGMGLKPRIDGIDEAIASGAHAWSAPERAAWSMREFVMM